MTRSLLIAKRERPYHKRISQACTFCRKRKVRCDGGEPCSFCRHLGTEPCVYALVEPKVKKAKVGKAASDAPSPSFSSSSYAHSSSSPSSASSSTFSEAQEYLSLADGASGPSSSSQNYPHHYPQAFTHLTAEFDPLSSAADFSLTGAGTECSDKMDPNNLMASLPYLHGGALSPRSNTPLSSWGLPLHHPNGYPSTMLYGSGSPLPSASASLRTSPTTSLCSLQTSASPQWTNTHDWTSQYLEPVGCQSSNSFDSKQTTCSVLATSYTTDALGLSFGDAMAASADQQQMASCATTSDPYYLTYSSMAQSDLFRRRALVFLSQIDCQ